MAVIGGGAIGCEFASMLSDLGTKVTVFEALPTILPGCDEDVVRTVARSFRKRGIDVKTGGPAAGAHPRPVGSGTTVVLRRRREAGGRRGGGVGGAPPAHRGPAGPGAPAWRSTTAASWWPTRPCAPRADGVWAVGDVVAGTPQLAHVGFAEGIVVIKGILGEPVVPVDYGRVPWAIYCHPEVAFAGLTEAAAKEAGFDVVVKKDPFGGNGRALIIGETEGLVKVVAERLPDGTTGRILGVHMVGPVGDRAAGAGLPGRQLGGHRRRGGPVHPAAPVPVRDLRRDRAGPDRKGAARWLT